MQPVTMRRRISPIDSFLQSVDALGSATARHLVHALLQALAHNPALAPDLDAWDVHVLRTRAYGPYPALSLYYKYDEAAVYPLYVEPCDPLPLLNPAAPDDA
jgi:hypothetical protein